MMQFKVEDLYEGRWTQNMFGGGGQLVVAGNQNIEIAEGQVAVVGPQQVVRPDLIAGGPIPIGEVVAEAVRGAGGVNRALVVPPVFGGRIQNE